MTNNDRSGSIADDVESLSYCALNRWIAAWPNHGTYALNAWRAGNTSPDTTAMAIQFQAEFENRVRIPNGDLSATVLVEFEATTDVLLRAQGVAHRQVFQLAVQAEEVPPRWLEAMGVEFEGDRLAGLPKESMRAATGVLTWMNDHAEQARLAISRPFPFGGSYEEAARCRQTGIRGALVWLSWKGVVRTDEWKRELPNDGQELCKLFDAVRLEVGELGDPSSGVKPLNAKAVYISYAWGNEGEGIVDRVYDSLKTAGYDVRRDKQHLPYTGNITEFMKEIGRGACIIVVVSDKSLRSPYCMFELLEIYRNQQFCERICPIVVSDAKIHSLEGRLEYVAYWKTEYQRLVKLVKNIGIDVASSNGSFGEYEKIRNISQNADKLLTMLGGKNSSTPTHIEANDFELLKQAVTERIEQSFIKSLS